MWWQGVNPGSPKHKGHAFLKVDGSSGTGNANFKGTISASNSTYNIINGKINGNHFSFI